MDTQLTRGNLDRVLIVGAGGFGREILNWALDVERTQSAWRIGGFLDGNAGALDEYVMNYPILGDPMDYQPQATDYFVCAIGDPFIKMRLVSVLQSRGARFLTVIHPSAIIGPRCRIGDGVVICPRAVVTCDADLGHHVSLNVGVTIGHNATLAEGCTVCPHAAVAGFARVGKRVFVGTNASILPQVKVSDGAVVGAGSVVIRQVKAGATVMGVPAKQYCIRSCV